MYVIRAQVAAKLPPQFFLEALDDDNDGVEDDGLWDAIVADADEMVDSILGQRFTVPFPASNIPPICRQAAKLFALETLYQRRGFGTEESNPFLISARAMRQKLNAIAKSNEPLTPSQKEANPSVSIVTEPARTTSRYGHTST